MQNLKLLQRDIVDMIQFFRGTYGNVKMLLFLES